MAARPRERDPGFFHVYSAVSVAVQRVLRQWLPYVYFSDIENYDDLGQAFPLLVYQSLRPFPGQSRGEFTYDVLSPNSPLLEGRFPTRALAHVLRRVSQLLTGAEKPARLAASLPIRPAPSWPQFSAGRDCSTRFWLPTPSSSTAW